MTQRFSVLPYANALPLVHFINEDAPKSLISYYSPRHSVASLLNGQADAALIPVIDLFAHPELTLVPGLGICANGEVTSVLLQCYRPLPTVRTIGLDPESKTSNVLVQVLAQKHFQLSRRVEFTHRNARPEANVCIGDRALRAAPALESYDLAGQWKEMTGLPFVFAVWAVRRSCPDIENITRILRSAKEHGGRSRPELAQLASQRLGLPEERCYDYLTRHLCYDLGPRELEGMNLFRDLAAEFLEPEAGAKVREVSSHAKRQVLPILERS